MTNLVDVYNLALTAIGGRGKISSPTEESREREMLDLWYPRARDQVLAAAPWPSAKAHQRLALIIERENTTWLSTDPDPGYRYAYAVPNDMLRPRYLTDFSRFTLSTMTDNTAAIMTNTEQAILVYSKRQENIDNFDPELLMAIAYATAAYIARPLTGKRDMASDAQGQANSLITQARLSAANAEETEHESIPEWITARGYGNVAPATRFFYPFGRLISVEGVGVN